LVEQKTQAANSLPLLQLHLISNCSVSALMHCCIGVYFNSAVKVGAEQIYKLQFSGCNC